MVTKENMEFLNKWFQPNKYLPLKLLLILEIGWTAVFASFVIWFQTADGAGLDAVRLALIIMAFHVSTPWAIINTVEEKDAKLRFLPVFWIWFSVFTDLWSVLDVQLHISKIPFIVSGPFEAMASLSIIAIVFSGITAVYYSVLLLRQGWEVEKVKETKTEKIKHRVLF
ncbi:MAG: hypothetical protein K2Q45_03875 [Nitrosomonas sp.]|nr:hypothetical protein [Nitrosomonas sp.]